VATDDRVKALLREAAKAAVSVTIYFIILMRLVLSPLDLKSDLYYDVILNSIRPHQAMI
jgi:hypothetical protein